MNGINKIVIFYNSRRRDSLEFYKKVKKYLFSLGLKTQDICVNKKCPDKIFGKLAISIGGDGTVLYASRHIVDYNLPMISINAGGLGFLSSVEIDRFKGFFNEVLKEKYKIVERAFLQINIKGKKYIALNDFVIRANEPRAFSLDVYYNDNFISRYFGDGLIISTPTGSTAYNLASSGPIIVPHANVFSLSPICPHTLSLRPIILPDTGELCVKFDSNDNKDIMRIVLSIDGQENLELSGKNRIYISRYPKTIKTLVPKNFSYFELLRKKLNWGLIPERKLS